MAGDAKYASVGLLLHGDGTDGGTTFTDNSPSPKTPAVIGGTTTSSTQSKYGGSSLRFANSPQSRISYDHDAAFQPTGNFCVEMWVYVPTVIGSNRVLAWKSISSGHRPYSIYIQSDGSIRAQSSNTSPAEVVSLVSPSAISANTWTNVCYERDGDTFRLYVNGTAVATSSFSGALYSNSGHPLAIGDVSDGIYPMAYNGTAYIDDLRVTMDSRYAGNFTPTGPFSDSDGSGGGGAEFSGSTVVEVTSQATGAVTVTGAGAATVGVTSIGTGTVDVEGQGSTTVDVTSVATGTVGNPDAEFSGSAVVSVTSQATGTVLVQGEGAATVDVTSTATGLVFGDAAFSGSAIVDVQSSGAASVLVVGEASAVVSVTSSGVVDAPVTGTGSAVVEVTSSGAGVVQIAGAGNTLVEVLSAAAGAAAITGQGATTINVASASTIRSGIRNFDADISVQTLLRKISVRSAYPGVSTASPVARVSTTTYTKGVAVTA